MAEALLGRAATAACMLTLAGGSLDAWTYIGHGHVFANAQTGNVVLAAMAAASGNEPEALRHVPAIAAFCLGIVASRLSGAWLKRHGLNSRTVRLLAEAAALAVLAAGAGTLGDGVATAVVGFLAAVQITALSHMQGWSFNTGMTTGNLRGALSGQVRDTCLCRARHKHVYAEFRIMPSWSDWLGSCGGITRGLPIVCSA